MPTNVTPYDIPVPDNTDPVDVPSDLTAMATAIGTALDGKVGDGATLGSLTIGSATIGTATFNGTDLQTTLDGKQPVYAVLFGQAVITGRFYGPIPTNNNNSFPTQNLLIATPFVVPVSASFDRITVNVMSAAAGSTVRLGVYAHNPATESPGALLFDAGTVDSSSTGAKEITITETLAAGIYWMAHVSQGGAPQLRGQLVAASIPFPATTANPSAANNTSWLPSQSSVSGALPNPMVPNGAVNNNSRVYLRGA